MSLDKSTDPNQAFRVKLGQAGKLRIFLSPKPKPLFALEQFQVKNDDDDALMENIGPDDELIGRRISRLWTFFDLGTRLRTVPVASTVNNLFRELDATDVPSIDPNLVVEYAEMNFDAPAEFAGNIQTLPESLYDPYSFNSQHLQVKLPEDATTVSDWDEKILGADARREADPEWRAADQLDPFGVSDPGGTGKGAQNCMPLPFGDDDAPSDPTTYSGSYGYNPDIYDVVLYSTPSAEFPAVVEYKYPNAKMRETVRDIRKAASDTQGDGSVWDSVEILTNALWKARLKTPEQNWNILNNPALTPKQAEMNVKTLKEKPKEFNVRVDTRLVYEPFDTGDQTNYKVTNTPYSSGPEVPFKLARDKTAKFFLKPSYLTYCRNLTLIHSVTSRIATYRYADSQGAPRYNHTSAQLMITNDGGVECGMYNQLNGSPDLAPFPVGSIIKVQVTDKDTDAGILTTPYGSYPFTGYISMNEKNCVVQGSISNASANGDQCTLEVIEAYPFSPQHFFNASAKVRRGIRAGRWPLFPRQIYAGFDSQYTWSGHTDYSMNYTWPYPIEAPYVAFLAAEMYGRNIFRGDLTEFYKRSLFRDVSDYIYFVKPIYTEYQSSAGQGRDLFEAGGPTTNVIHPVGTGYNVWKAAYEAAMQDIKAQIEAEPHVGTVNFESENTVFRTDNQMDILPLDALVGLLCGVIEQSGKRYYIWRKTISVRGGYDYDRNQALANHNNTV